MNIGQTDAVLSLNNLRAGYGQTEILHDLSIYVNPNEIVAIIGPNGAGKSTAMKAVLGLLNTKYYLLRYRLNLIPKQIHIMLAIF